MATEQRRALGLRTNSAFIQLALDDFQRTEDGAWITTRQIDIIGPGEPQRLLSEGHRFTPGQMTRFGLDLAVILEKQFI